MLYTANKQTPRSHEYVFGGAPQPRFFVDDDDDIATITITSPIKSKCPASPTVSQPDTPSVSYYSPPRTLPDLPPRPMTPTLLLLRPETPKRRFHHFFPSQSVTEEISTEYSSCGPSVICQEEDEKNPSPRDVLHQKGYQILDKIQDCPQGAQWRANVLEEGSVCPGAIGSVVSIKRMRKALGTVVDLKEFGITELAEEDVVREAAITKHCTLDIRASDRHILKFIDFFETQSEYFLVTEWDENLVSTKTFVDRAHVLMAEGLLRRKNYTKTVKYLLWQLLATLQWLHEAIGCCHLKLGVETVMLSDADFLAQPDGSYTVSDKITIKLSDFALAEMFDGDSFKCFKNGPLSPHVCPEMFHGAIYDARKADVFSVGHILYYCWMGATLYDADEMWDTPRGGWAALQRDALREHLEAMKSGGSMRAYFKKHSFEVLRRLLTYDEEKRPCTGEVMECEWFRFYLRTNGKKLKRKIAVDRRRSAKHLATSSIGVPLYTLDDGR